MIFDNRELELLIGGITCVDLADWKKNTDYRGFTESSEQIKWFWSILDDDFDDEQRIRLYQFATGTSRIPVNGFKELQGSDGPHKFTIERVPEAHGQLPCSHTCFNRIDMPEYSDRETLKQKLVMAMEESSGFTIK